MELIQTNLLTLRLSENETQTSALKDTIDQLKKDLVKPEVVLKSVVVNEIVLYITTIQAESTTPFMKAAMELIATLLTYDVVKQAMQNRPRPIIDALFTCLKNNLTTPAIQQLIFKAIGNLTEYSDPSGSQDWLVAEYDAINVISQLLTQFSHIAELQTQAYYALQKIAFGHETNIVLLFNTFRIYEPVLKSMAAYCDDIPLLTQSCALLRRLAFVDETNSTLMVNAVHFSLNTMRSLPFEAEIQEHVCNFLSNMFVSEDHKKSLVEEPYMAHVLIFAAMRNHAQNAQVQRQACGALFGLLTNAQNRKRFVAEPYLAHEMILSAMHNHPLSAGVLEFACSSIWNLACESEYQLRLVREPYFAHQAVLMAMHNHPHVEKIQENGCGALANLAVAVHNRKLLIECDAHMAVIAALRAHPQDERVQVHAVSVLSHLSKDAFAQLALRKLDAIELCEKALRTFPDNAELISRIASLETLL